MKKAILIFKKEILDAVRDSRTFYVCIITPFLLYPILFMVMGYFIQSERTKEERLIYKIGIINQSLMEGFLTHVEAAKNLDVVEGEEHLAMFKNNKVKAVLEVKNANGVVVFYDGADKESQNALKRINKLLSEYQDAIIKKRILKQGLSEEILMPIAVEKENIAPAKRMGGFILGALIPYLLIIIAFQGAMRVGIDITAGEKERKTIETLLVTDVKRSEIVIGKCLAGFVLAFLSTISGLLGLVITLQSGFSVFTQIGRGLTLAIPWLSCLFMLFVMLPLLWFFSSVLVAIGSASRSIKQATTYSSYCLIFVVVLTVFSVLRITVPGRIVFLIPVLNTAILQQQILIGEIYAMNLLITIVSSILYAMIAYLFAKHNFEKEEILLRS
ncbi:ABC transporter permease [candidate division WOR-3 bacterium]|nr:ABC transporter permease [candidate division WOR-3 bacterium]